MPSGKDRKERKGRQNYSQTEVQDGGDETETTKETEPDYTETVPDSVYEEERSGDYDWDTEEDVDRERAEEDELERERERERMEMEREAELEMEREKMERQKELERSRTGQEEGEVERDLDREREEWQRRRMEMERGREGYHEEGGQPYPYPPEYYLLKVRAKYGFTKDCLY